MGKIMRCMNSFGFGFNCKLGLKRLVLLDFYSNFLFNCLFMMAQPSIVIYMISNVDPVWYKATLIINTGGVLIGGFFLNNKRLNWLRKHFTYICLADSILMIFINTFFGHLPNIRFVMIAMNEAFITYYIMQIIDDMYNNAFRKSTITLIQNRGNGYSSAGTLTGVAISVFVPLGLDVALMVSTAAIIIDSLVSVLLRQRMGSLIKGYNK